MSKYLKARTREKLKREASEEHPILFKTEMVRAILKGRKTQTRRVIKPQPVWDHGAWTVPGFFCNTDRGFSEGVLRSAFKCPYGVIGDRLWVREAWRPIFDQGGTGMYLGTTSEHIEYRASEGERLALKCTRAQSGLSYVGEPENYSRIFSEAKCWSTRTGGSGKWRPSIFMPRWASRILLDEKDIRVERLQEITEENAKAEGCNKAADDLEDAVYESSYPEDGYFTPSSYVSGFRALWDSINAKPKPVYCRDEDGKKVIDHYVSYPWEDVQEIRAHSGKPWHVKGNPWLYAIRFGRVVA